MQVRFAALLFALICAISCTANSKPKWTLKVTRDTWTVGDGLRKPLILTNSTPVPPNAYIGVYRALKPWWNLFPQPVVKIPLDYVPMFPAKAGVNLFLPDDALRSLDDGMYRLQLRKRSFWSRSIASTSPVKIKNLELGALDDGVDWISAYRSEENLAVKVALSPTAPTTGTYRLIARDDGHAVVYEAAFTVQSDKRDFEFELRSRGSVDYIELVHRSQSRWFSSSRDRILARAKIQAQIQEAVCADVALADPAKRDVDDQSNNGSGTSFGGTKVVQQVNSRKTITESAGQQMKPLLTRQLSEIDSQLGSEQSDMDSDTASSASSLSVVSTLADRFARARVARPLTTPENAALYPTVFPSDGRGIQKTEAFESIIVGSGSAKARVVFAAADRGTASQRETPPLTTTVSSSPSGRIYVANEKPHTPLLLHSHIPSGRFPEFSTENSEQCAAMLMTLIENAMYLGHGEQGIVFNSSHPTYGELVVKIGARALNSKVAESSESEARVLVALTDMMDHKRVLGFPRFIGARRCTVPNIDWKNGTIESIPTDRPPVETMYIVMERVKYELPAIIGRKPVMSTQEFAFYLLQGIMTIVVAQEDRFVGRGGSWMVYEDRDVGAVGDCQTLKGHYGLKLPSGQRYIFPRRTSCGRYLKYIDVGQSAILDIDTIDNADTGIKFESNYGRRIDLLNLFDDLLYYTPIEVFEQLKAENAESYKSFLRLVHDVYGILSQSVVNFMSIGDSERDFKFIRHIKDQNKSKRRLFSENSLYLGLTPQEAAQHPFFGLVFRSVHPRETFTDLTWLAFARPYV